MPELLNPASNKTDPLILQKLQAFADRRRKLIIFRGIYAAVATLLVAMMVVAFLDWLFVLPDPVRWALSGVAYLAIIVVEWRSCWRLLLHAPGSRQLARLVEHAEPKLREDLLSAVELGDEGGQEIFDSEEFRALVQSDVAARVEKLDVEELLPARLLRRYTFIAIGVGVACIIAFALTGFQFGTLMMRALLPMANFARVSKVKVHIVEPSPAEMRVAQGDTLPLIIELSGQSTNKATLETFTPSGGREVVPMTPLARDRFSATIQVGRENVYYRVRAGDALTRKYLLEAVARPAVVQFKKSYTYPAYSRLEPKTLSEENGDLSALEGSQVELRLTTNQKVRDAELRIEQGKKNTVVPLTLQDNELTAKVPIDVSGIYRVHLVGAESGFENKFSPEYELRAEPDLVPQVELESPKQDLILASNEIVEIQGNASDDFALAKVSQWVKINDGGWKETVLVTDPGAKAKVERRWDLFDQGVKPGDLVTTKLVATDLKGNRAESRPTQVTITAAGFESKRLQALGTYRKLFEALKTEQVAASTLVRQASEAKQQCDRLPDGDPQQSVLLTPVSASIEDLVQKNGDTMKQLAATIRDAAPGHVSGDLDLIGRGLVHLQRDGTESARHTLEVLESNRAGQSTRELLGETMGSIARTEQILRQTVENCRSLLTSEEIDVLNENLQVVSHEQDRLLTLAHHSGTDTEKWTPVANRLRVVLAEIRSLEELAGAVIEHGTHGVPDRMRNLQKLLNKRRTALETGLGVKPGVELLGPTMELSQAVTDASHQALDMDRDFRPRTVEVLRNLTTEAKPSYQSFQQLRDENQRLLRNNRLPVEVDNALIQARWAAHLDAWKNRGDVEEWRPDSDSYFVNDLRQTTRVLQSLHDRVAGDRTETWSKDLQAIDQNFRVLECGHWLSELVDGATHLAAGERWELYNPKARTTNPHDWSWLGERLRTAPEEIGNALNFNERRPLAQAAQKILWETANQEFTRSLQREMDERFTFGREPVSARDSVEEYAAWLKQALDLFREPMEEARKNLAQMVPTLAEEMKNLAKKTDDLRDKTVNQAQQVHDQAPEEAKSDAQRALAEQQQLNQKVEGLKDALRADANKQNVMEKEGRERARDADDAVAMLREPPRRAEEDLELAAKSDKAATQEQALNQAAEQQEKLSQALQQMADHYAALDKGKAEETRAAMRATEQATGVKDQLDQDYAKMEQLAKMAQSTPEEMLAQLEKALPQNPHMQKELSAISQNTLKGAAEQLKQASAQENTVAQNVQKMTADEQAQAAAAAAPQNNPAGQNPANPSAPQPQPNQANNTPNAAPANPANAPPQNGQQPNSPQNTPAQPPASNPALAQSAQQQTPIAKTATQVADDVMRAGRHETRLDNKVAGEQLEKLGQQVAANAQQQVPGAQQALQKAQQATQAQPAVNTANTGLQKSLEQLNAIANPAQATAEAPSSAQQKARPTPPESGPADAQAQANAAQQKSPQSSPAGKTAQAASDQASQSAKAAPQSQTGQQSPTGQQAQNAQNAAAQSGQAKAQTAAQANSKNGQPAQGGQAGQQGQSSEGTPQNGSEAALAAAPASPQEQVWMARTLDALDAALHSHTEGDEIQEAASGMKQSQKDGQQAQGNAQASPQKSQSAQTSAANSAGSKPAPQSAIAQAQSAMQKAAEAAARQARQEAGSPNEAGEQQQGTMQAKSQGGSQSEGGAHGALGEAKNKAGDWGKLPKQMAEQLTQGQQEGIAGEYRNQVETYYRVIAEKSKKP